MHSTFIPETSWQVYIDRKAKDGQDPNCFSPEILWEFDFLVNLIQRERPHLDQLTVTLAVREGMRRTIAPRLRNHFVQLVLNDIHEREHRWSQLVENAGNLN